MARFLELKLRNFLSWRRLDLNLADRSLLFIFGENGSGKSSIRKALEWGLYGKSGRGVRSDDVVNNRLAADCRVTVAFEGDTGQRYELTRYRRHERFGDHVFLRKEDKDVTCATIPATQQRLERALQLSRVGFRNSVLFDPNSSEFFSSCTDAEQKRILKEVLGLEVFGLCYKQARELQMSSREKMSKYENEIEARFDLKHSIKVRMRRLQAEQQEQADKRGKRLNELKAKHVKLSSQLKVLKPGLEICVRDVEGLHAARRKKDRAYTRAKHDLATLLQGLEHKDKLVGKLCPMCGQLVTEKSLAKTIREYQKREKHLRVQVLKLARANKRADNELQNAEQTQSSFEMQVSDAKARVEEISKEIAAVEEETGNLDAILAEDKKESERATKELHGRRIWLVKATRQEALADFWVRGFGIYGIELFALREALPILNYKIKTYLSQLPTFKGFIKQHFLINPANGKLAQEIKFRGGDSYEALSTGERARVDLADQLALHDLVTSRSSTFNVLFLDEVFKGFDDRGIDGAVQLLESLRKESLFVISHEQRLKDQFTNILKVKQDKRGFSYLAE